MMHRRQFIRATAGLAAAAMAPAVHAVHVSDKSGRRNPILGDPNRDGSHAYECIHDWLRPPSEIAWGDTHGLAQDAAGRIYVAHTVHPESQKPHAVVVSSPEGDFVGAWGEEYRGGAHGLDIRAEGGEEYLYHCDTRRRLVVKTDLEGRVVWQADCPMASGKYESREKWCPTNVAFLPDGDILVGDGYGSSYVHRFGSDGVYKSTPIGPGKEAGQVLCPHGLWVDDRIVERGRGPTLLVADRSNRRVQRFTLEGEHLGFMTDGIRMPCHFKTRGDLLLVPDLESVVTLVGMDGKPVVQLGDGHPSGLRDKPRGQFVDGKFIHPHSAIFLRNGDILVAEWVPIGRVTLLRRVG